MSEYRRNYVPGGTYFFTVVTYERRRILCSDQAREALRDAITSIRIKLPLDIIASVLLPDHFHCIWTLPPGDSNYSRRWRQIKERFTRSFLELPTEFERPSYSRRKHRERSVWQRRFWEHTVCDTEDLERCSNYIHWNPVKHGLVSHVKDWAWSSFHRFVEAGTYQRDWGNADPCPGFHSPEWE